MKRPVIKIALQAALALLLIGSVTYFIRNQHTEVQAIAAQLAHARADWLLTGIALTAVFVALQMLMYRYCFRATGAEMPLPAYLRLYLKRNLASLFLPAGGVTSLALFTAEAERAGIPKTKIHFASTLRLLVGTLTVTMVAAPVLIWVTLRQGLSNHWMGLVWLLGTIAALAWALYSLRNGGRAVDWIGRVAPRFGGALAELRTHPFRLPEALRAVFCSMLLEAVGILHLWVAMKTLGLSVGWEVAMVGYVAVLLAIMASPLLKGLGAAEAALTWALTQQGLTLADALATALVFRLFEFWLPLLGGIVVFVCEAVLRYLNRQRIAPQHERLHPGLPVLPGELAATNRFLGPDPPKFFQNLRTSLQGSSFRNQPPEQ